MILCLLPIILSENQKGIKKGKFEEDLPSEADLWEWLCYSKGKEAEVHQLREQSWSSANAHK